MDVRTRRYARPHEVQLVRWLFAAGLNNCQISRATGIARPTVRDWRGRPGGWPAERASLHQDRVVRPCPRCHGRDLDEHVYAYLLGLYLGDGTISRQPKGRSYRLRIFCADAYPGLITQCRDAMRTVKDVATCRGMVQRQGCVEVNMSWPHWPCLFPQHGPGMKHQRRIELEGWQQVIVARYPEDLLRGLIHSDGYRGDNVVFSPKGKRYSYPRYQFSNHSANIRDIFCAACDLAGIRWRRMNWKTISVARRDDVRKLDSFIGPKH